MFPNISYGVINIHFCCQKFIYSLMSQQYKIDDIDMLTILLQQV